jgi:hypothetical protein
MNPALTHILFLWVHFNIIFPSTSRFSLWSLLSTHFCLFHTAVIVQLFTELQPLYSLDDSSRCSQEHTTGPYPDPVETSPYSCIIRLRSILILSPRVGWSFLSGLFTPGFLTKILCVLLIRVSRSQIPKLLSLTWNTFRHIFMGSHLSYLWFLFYCCTVLRILIWILLNLIQLRHFCLSLRMYRTRTHRYFCPSQERGLLAHGRVWTAPVWCC